MTQYIFDTIYYKTWQIYKINGKTKKKKSDFILPATMNISMQRNHSIEKKYIYIIIQNFLW